jgi:hypothetical protein
MPQALSIDQDPGPVTAIAVVTAMIEAQYSQPPFGKKMKYPTRAWTVIIATDMSATTAIQDSGVANPITNRTPATISAVVATIACCFGHFIPILPNHDAVPEIPFALLMPW